MNTPTAYTPEELREKFLNHARYMVKYWASQAGTVEQNVEGAIFSLLVAIDGGSMGLPAFDLVARPHPEDKRYAMGLGERWIENGTVINDCQLHELLNK